MKTWGWANMATCWGPAVATSSPPWGRFIHKKEQFDP